jgi:hypothetical protein
MIVLKLARHKYLYLTVQIMNVDLVHMIHQYGIVQAIHVRLVHHKRCPTATTTTIGFLMAHTTQD